MKKKIKLEEIAVKSFVTKVSDHQVKGGGESRLCPDNYMTNFSCYQYISCNPAACLVTRHNDPNNVVYCGKTEDTVINTGS